MDDAHSLDLVRAVAAQHFLDLRRIDAVPPIARHELDLDAEPSGHLPPQGRELPGLEHQHFVARRQRVDERRLPRSRARGRIDDHRAAGLEHLLHAGDDFLAELGELGPAMVDRREAHRVQDAIRHVRRPRDLQKMPAGMDGRGVFHRRRLVIASPNSVATTAERDKPIGNAAMALRTGPG